MTKELVDKLYPTVSKTPIIYSNEIKNQQESVKHLAEINLALAGTSMVQQDAEFRYAKNLAEFLFKKHFSSDKHYASGQVVWEPLDTTLGILTQIENMVSTLVRVDEAPDK
jgi:hypothetical protein